MSVGGGWERRIQLCVWHWNSICSEEEDGWRRPGIMWGAGRGNGVAIQWPGSRARAWHCPAAIAITLPVFARSRSGVSVREDTPETPETVRTQISSVPWSHTPHTDMEQTNRHFMSKYPHWLSNVAEQLGTFSNWQTFDSLQILNFNGWSTFSTTLNIEGFVQATWENRKVFWKVSNICAAGSWRLYLSFPVTSFHFHACYNCYMIRKACSNKRFLDYPFFCLHKSQIPVQNLHHSPSYTNTFTFI